VARLVPRLVARLAALVGGVEARAAMYTVAKGPAGILQKTRRGLARSRGESLGEVGGRQEQGELDQEANIVFQPLRMRNQQRRRAEPLTPEHRELVTFVTEHWGRVKREVDQGTEGVAVYRDTTNPRLAAFQPFDLDAWWGKKLYQDLTSGV